MNPKTLQLIKKTHIFAFVLMVCLVLAPFSSGVLANGAGSDEYPVTEQADEESINTEQDSPDDGTPEPDDQSSEATDSSELDKDEELTEPEDENTAPEQPVPDEPSPEEDTAEESDESTEMPPDDVPGEVAAGAEEATLFTDVFALADDIAIVRDLAGLEAALGSATITTVHLDADIVLPLGGIKINPSKPYLIIDGTNPYDGEALSAFHLVGTQDEELESIGTAPSPDEEELESIGQQPTDANLLASFSGDARTIHTLTEYNSSTAADAIRLETNGALKDIKLQNINVVGRNYYGIVCIYDAVLNVTQTFENFTYTGPQPAYNRFGTVHFIDSTVYRVYGYASSVGEVAEAANVILEGNVYLEDKKTTDIAYSTFWMEYKLGGKTDGNITIRAGAHVTCIVSLPSSYFTLLGPTVKAKLIVEEGAVFEYKGTGIFILANPLKEITVKDSARMVVSLSRSNINAAVLVNGDLTVERNAVFHVIAEANSLFPVLSINGGSAAFHDPKSVVLSRPNGPPLQYGVAGGQLDVIAQQINYWSAYSTGTSSETPLYSWRKADGSNLIFSATVGSGPPGSITAVRESSYISLADETDLAIRNAPPSAATFDLANARTLAFGSLPLTAECLYSGEGSHIQGTTDPDATVHVLKKETGESSYSFMDSAIASDGTFDIASAQNLKDASIKVRSYAPYLVSQKDFLVTAPFLTVEFQTLRGTPPPSQQVEWGSRVARPPDPIDPELEMDFDGWYRDEALTDPWDFDADTVTVHLTLYAKWNPKPTYTVVINHIRLSTGEPVAPPEEKQYRAQSETSPATADLQEYKVVYYKIGQDPAEHADGSPFTVNGDMEINIYYRSTVIEMEVPMQMLFAAFQSDGGEIVSLRYAIVNRSDMPVKVQLQELQSDDQSMADMDLQLVQNAINAGDLQLDLMNKDGFARSIVGIQPNITLNELGYLGTLGGFGQNNRQGEIAIGGKYVGPFSVNYKQPRVSFVFQFQLVA